MPLSRFEKIVLILLAATLWVTLAIYAGGPIFSDEFMYIDIGLRNYTEPSYGNRYFHVYLQKLFMELAPTPLQGVRVFWGLMIALTAALIYYNARTFLRDSNPLHGLLAVAFFFSFPLVTEYSGEPAVDITAMLIASLYVTLYLIAMRQPEKKKLALVLLGMLVFLAFKTKETTIFINFLLVGFALNDNGKWNWHNVWKMVTPLLIGLAGGILLFMLLDGLILGNPFFAISPATFGAIFTHYDFGKVFFNGPVSWYREYFLDDLLLPFLLFVVGGIKLKDELNPQKKLIWIYPLVMAVFVTWNMTKIPWGFIERFYFPALPFIAMLAPQFLRFQWPKKAHSWLWFGLLLAGAGVLILVMRLALMEYAESMSFEYIRLLDSLYYPILLSILLAAIIWIKHFEWFRAVLPIFCISAMLLSPLSYTIKYFFHFPKVEERYTELVYPFASFKDELIIRADDDLFVSQNLDNDLNMLSDDPNDIIGMYNFYFDARIDKSNVYLGYSRKSMAEDLVNKDFEYALLTQSDWKRLQENAETAQTLEGLYQVQTDPRSLIVLLVEK